MVTITKTDDLPMQEYLGKIQDINRKINKVGIEFPDNLLACFFLMGLPKALVMKNTNWKVKRNTEKYDRNKYGRAEASSKVIFCFSCGGKGHIAKFCRNANKKDENNEASGSVAAVSREYRALCMNKKEQVYNINEWTLDSGATDHMTPFKEILCDFIEVIWRMEDRAWKCSLCSAIRRQFSIA
ncbi:hypothetical protein QE152_g37690 [Popillia japonica]